VIPRTTGPPVAVFEEPSMGVTPLRLLLTTAALVVGAACMPALAAEAVPEHAVAHADHGVAAMTQRVPVLGSAAQRLSDTDGRMVGDPMPEPPVWLLVLLVPILVGGAVGTGVTLRRLR
jgi:hypothetical protein